MKKSKLMKKMNLTQIMMRIKKTKMKKMRLKKKLTQK